MLREALHHLPPVMLALALAAAVLLPLALATRLFGLDEPGADRSNDNVSTAAARFVGGAFALLSAFLIVSLSSQGGAARNAVRAEAAAADSFAREARRLPAPLGPQLLQGVEAYLDEVVHEEWAGMDDHERHHDAADDEMDRLFDLLLGSPPAAYDTRYDLAVKSLDRLEERRVERLLTAREPLPGVLWAVLLTSASALLVVAALYPAGGRRSTKWVQLIATGAVVAVVLFVVLSLEHAYSGFLAVEPGALEAVLRELRP